MTLGEKMIRYRAKHRMTQEEFSKLAGISIQTISYIEREKQAPSRITKAKIEMIIEEDEEA